MQAMPAFFRNERRVLVGHRASFRFALFGSSQPNRRCRSKSESGLAQAVENSYTERKSPLVVNYIRQQSAGDVLRNMFAIYGKEQADADAARKEAKELDRKFSLPWWVVLAIVLFVLFLILIAVAMWQSGHRPGRG